MRGAATALITVGGLVLSFACAVLAEELFLGGLFRLFFAPRPGNTGAPDNRRFCGWRGGGAEKNRGSGRVK